MIGVPEAPAEVQKQARELAQAAPCPAQVRNVLFGTAGWTDPTLIKQSHFYPPSMTSPKQRLGFYSSQFSMVEVDATYYAIPSAKVAHNWLAAASPQLVFDIKAHPIFTGHPVERLRLPNDVQQALTTTLPHKARLYPQQIPTEIRSELVRRFNDFLEPLKQANRIGCVMVQLPPWTTATRGAARELETLPNLLPNVPIGVEFRHPSWLEAGRVERVRALLRSHNLSYVCVDEPDVATGGVPALVFSTHAELAILRLHGHNAEGWRPGASVLERFNYLYANRELEKWLRPVQVLSEEARQVHVVFNNCVRDYAVVNAKGLAALLLRYESNLAVGPNPC